jgi:hypothetical protein
VNTIADVGELIVPPFSVTDHAVPDGSPVSENVTVKVLTDTTVNVTATVCERPVTVTDPDDGEAAYPETEPTA